MRDRRVWFLAGLFFTTLATLTLEILNTRLLSVLTWYHLSFFAVSTAMFGMSAGAVRVYLGGAVFEGDGARRALARLGTWFALSIPFSHIANLCIPIPSEISLTSISALVLTTLSLAVPSSLSALAVADLRVFSNTTAAAWGLKVRMFSASSTFFPRMRSATLRTFLADILMNRALALASMTCLSAV